MPDASLRAPSPAPPPDPAEAHVLVARMPGSVCLMYLDDLGIPLETWLMEERRYTPEKLENWKSYVRGQETGRTLGQQEPGTVYALPHLMR